MADAFQRWKMQSDAYWIYNNMKDEYLMDGVKLEHVKVEKVRSSAFFVTVRAGTAYWKI